jgi:hypothetical protein
MKTMYPTEERKAIPGFRSPLRNDPGTIPRIAPLAELAKRNTIHIYRNASRSLAGTEAICSNSPESIGC